MPLVNLRIQNPDGQGMTLPNAFFAKTETEPGPATHATFELLKARPDCIRAFTLRSQAELDAIVSDPVSCLWRYIPGQPHEYAPTAIGIDGALLGKPPRANFPDFPCIAKYGPTGDENVPGQHALKLRYSRLVTSGILVVRWDQRWRPEVQANRGTVNTYKTDFVYGGDGIGATTAMMLCKDSLTTNQNETLAPDECTFPYTELIANGLARAPGTQMLGSSSPVLVSTGRGAVPHRGYKTKVNKWQRYVLEIRLNQPGSAFVEWSQDRLGGAPLDGTWDMYSYWIGDEGGAWRRMVYRVPHPRKGLGYGQMYLNWDTSTNNIHGPAQAGPIAADVRSWVALNPTASVVEGDPVLFELPKP